MSSVGWKPHCGGARAPERCVGSLLIHQTDTSEQHFLTNYEQVSNLAEHVSKSTHTRAVSYKIHGRLNAACVCVCVSDDVYNVNTSTVFCLLQWSSANSPKSCVCARRHVSKCKISMCVCVSVCELMYQTGTYSCFPIIKPVWTWIYYESNKKQTTWGSHLASRWGKTGFQCRDPTGNQVLKEGGSAQV